MKNFITITKKVGSELENLRLPRTSTRKDINLVPFTGDINDSFNHFIKLFNY